MSRQVAFLRGINLGKRRIAMSDLAELFRELGLKNVETFIASGNVLFDSRATRPKLEQQIAAHLETALGYQVDTFVRTLDQVTEISAAKHDAVASDVSTIHVGFLQQAPSQQLVRAWEAIVTNMDRFRVLGDHFYWYCDRRITESKVFSSAAFKSLAIPTMTMRNITSIRKLVAKHG